LLIEMIKPSLLYITAACIVFLLAGRAADTNKGESISTMPIPKGLPWSFPLYTLIVACVAGLMLTIANLILPFTYPATVRTIAVAYNAIPLALLLYWKLSRGKLGLRVVLSITLSVAVSAAWLLWYRTWMLNLAALSGCVGWLYLLRRITIWHVAILGVGMALFDTWAVWLTNQIATYNDLVKGLPFQLYFMVSQARCLIVSSNDVLFPGLIAMIAFREANRLRRYEFALWPLLGFVVASVSAFAILEVTHHSVPYLPFGVGGVLSGLLLALWRHGSCGFPGQSNRDDRDEFRM